MMGKTHEAGTERGEVDLQVADSPESTRLVSREGWLLLLVGPKFCHNTGLIGKNNSSYLILLGEKQTIAM